MLQLTKVNKAHFYLIGVGGTGAFFLESLCRLLAGRDDVTIDLYDGDTVESKNLKRQNFGMNDLDQNKAQALATNLQQKILRCPKLKVHAQYLTDTSLIDELVLAPQNESPIIVDCTDNAASRQLINQIVAGLEDAIDVIVLSSGNHDQGGQVVVWSNRPAQLQGLNGKQDVKLQSMTDLFPATGEIKDQRDENPGITTTCTDQVESKPQAMMANVFNGNVLASLAFSLVNNETIAANVFRLNLSSLTITNQNI